MYQFDPLTTKQDYEDHVRWLRRLYGNRSSSHLLSRWLNWLLYKFGGGLVSIGERLQLRSHPLK